MITVGGIATKPRYVDGNLEPRELLDIRISVDHAIVDGATAARFTRRRLAGLLENPLHLADSRPLSAGRDGDDAPPWAGSSRTPAVSPVENVNCATTGVHKHRRRFRAG
jgi:hypothetical protein